MHQSAFIPPQPERPARQPRMPRIEDLPAPAQKELRASRGEDVDTAHPEKRGTWLLQRLASVGLGRRDDDQERAEQPSQAKPRAAAPPGDRSPPAQRPEATGRAQEPRAQESRVPDSRAQEPRSHDPVSDYAKRPSTPQGLDSHGRQVPVLNAFDDDQLEIPAFLRRQAN